MSAADDTKPLELSIVLPCLNEAETLAQCVSEAQAALTRNAARGEVVVADNGSEDDSRRIAESLGARVVAVPERGYGNALRGGIAAARGEFVVLADADGSHDFADIDLLLAKLREGYDLVVGNRFRGVIAPGALPLSHRYLGNPMFNLMGRVLYGSPARDLYCGLRGFRRAAYERMRPRGASMEFAPEMVVRANLQKLRIAEVPANVRKAGRTRESHVRTWSDGWRTIGVLLGYRLRGAR